MAAKPVGVGADAQVTKPELARVVDIDLENQTIKGPDGGTIHFEIDPFRKDCLLKGLDDVGLTLEKTEQISSFEAARGESQPWA